jgi:hypothetical protein
MADLNAVVINHYEKPDSVWKRYNIDGQLVGTDRYVNGQKVN